MKKIKMLQTLFADLQAKAVSEKSEIRGLLALSMFQHMVIEIAYADKDGVITTRSIEPVEFQDNNNVLAHCQLRDKEYRAFKFEWIISARWTGETFVPQEEVHKPAKLPTVS